MSATPNLGLPYIDAGQAQKHVTHNEALRALDTLVQLAVQDRDLAAPPASPTEGARWIVSAGAAGAWASHTGHIAAWQDGAWAFSVPQAGWIAYVIDEEILVAWDGDSWNAVSAGEGGAPTELQNLSLLGVGDEADAANPVSMKLNNALWTAKTVAEGGDGSLRYKMSKESAEKTLSILLQDNFVGCAEIGLTGDDDFQFKVSPDGTNWLESIRIDRATGKVSFPSGGARELLTANRTYYVRTDGSDLNDGLSNTPGGAFLTLQKAIDAVAALDLSTFNVTIQVADGTYTSGVVVNGPWVGSRTVTLQGNAAAPSNCVISTTGADCILVQNFGRLEVLGFKCTTGTSGAAIHARNFGAISITGNMVYGTCAGTISASAHLFAEIFGSIKVAAAYSITGSAPAHYLSITNSVVDGSSLGAITLSGTLNFSGAFAYVTLSSALRIQANTYSGGTITGPRYNVTTLGVIQTAGGGANYLPGDAAGTSASGGTYA